MTRRRFAVIGLGSFGRHVARALYDGGQDVLAVDREPAALEAIRDHCSAVCLADAADRGSLEQAGVSTVDVGVVGLGGMDVSIVTTMYLRDIGVKEIVVKALTPDHARVLRRVGASDIVHPEEDVALRLARRLARPDVLEELPFLEGYVLTQLRAPPALWGLTLARSDLRGRYHLAVVAVKRPGAQGTMAMPAVPGQTIEQGDVLVALALPADLDRFRKHFNL